MGVAERAPMSQDALREGDDFFDECADWMAASAMQRPVYDMPAQN